MQILPHALVRVRRGRWRVADVRAYDDCALVTLCGAAPPYLGVDRRVLSPFDRVEPIEHPRSIRRVSRRAWRRRCRALIAAETPPGCLRAAGRARIDLLPYQLEPALAIVRGRGCRVLLADAVGLGKTIQAGLIAAELLARGAIERTLIVAPSGLRDQWRHELGDRFGIEAAVVDARAIRQSAATLPYDVNPWSTLTIAIASIDFVKRVEVLPAASARPWDLVIVDEAHGAASDSDRRAAAQALCASATYVLLLTATPHNGDARAFEALCGIGRVPEDRLIMFRRTAADAGVARRRRVHTLHVRLTGAERRMHASLRAYGAAVLAERRDAALGLCVLQKRAFSSAAALVDSVDRRLAALDGTDVIDADTQLALPLDGDGDVEADDVAPPWPEEVTLRDRARDRSLLRAVAAAARAAAATESKVRALVRLLRRTADAVIVFTEFRDTLRHVEAALAAWTDRPILRLHGGLTREERNDAVAAFARRRRAVLLATDAAGEGLNLHAACRLVVNVELPWNPMRLEQRIGRVDRIGQTRVVHAIHLVARAGETAVLERLRARLASARNSIGAPDPLEAPGEPSETASVATTDLRSAGEQESERLRRVRPLAGCTDTPDGKTCTARARPRLRRSLRGRRLEVWRVSAEDACGQVAESRLVPLLVDPAHRGEREAIAAATASWREDVRHTTSAFAAARVARNEAIAAAIGDPGEGYQPGLFDRRRERQHARDVAARADRGDRIARRVEAARQAAQLTFSGPNLLLVMGV